MLVPHFLGQPIKDIIIKAMMKDIVRHSTERLCFYFTDNGDVISYGYANPCSIEILSWELASEEKVHHLKRMMGLMTAEVVVEEPTWREKDLVPRLDELE